MINSNIGLNYYYDREKIKVKRIIHQQIADQNPDPRLEE